MTLLSILEAWRNRATSNGYSLDDCEVSDYMSVFRVDLTMKFKEIESKNGGESCRIALIVGWK